MDYSTNDHLQEVCEIKQPILFEYKTVSHKFISKVNYDNLSENKYDNIDIKIKNSNDYWENQETVDYVVLNYGSATNLMKTDTNGKYFSELNQEFLEESGLLEVLQDNDVNIKPNFSILSKYDIFTGSKDAITPLKYHTGYRKFISINSGKIRIKLTPWKSTKYLYTNKDYENYEFTSPINAWKPQKKYMHEMDKIKFLEFEVLEGYMIYIPPYWWYSIQYSSDNESILCEFNYNSVINYVANLPDNAKYYLQQHNIKKRITKTLELNESIIKETSEPENILEIEKKSGTSDVTENIKIEKVEPTQLQDIIS